MSETGSGAKQEISFYSDDGGVRVTSSRLIIGTTTYAMLNITSVTRTSEPPSRVLPLILIIGGLFFFLRNVSGPNTGVAVFGFFLLLIGGIMWKGQKTKYHLRISSASGEANAVTDTDMKRVDKIVQAVNEAIIGRGQIGHSDGGSDYDAASLTFSSY